MKKLFYVAILIILGSVSFSAFADIKYINGYMRKDGTYVSGHYRDTSNDGYSYNNANTLGYNSRKSRGSSYGDNYIYDNSDKVGALGTPKQRRLW